MKLISGSYCFIFFIFLVKQLTAQEMSLFDQWNGHMDYTAIGNTLNIVENNSAVNCSINTSSSASLNLAPNQTIEAAYLYWAGSGTGDFNVKLNSISITADRTFEYSLDTNRQFFAAFKEVTELIQDLGNELYTLSELEQIDISESYCNTGTNFAGWALFIIYSDPSLPLNQLNVYDGLESVPDSITIQLDNLNVLDTTGAKIGFLAWEGDAGLAVNEVLQMNGITLSNPPLNPANNAFNGTNSFTNTSDIYNMDIDFYPIQNTINIGDTSALIQLTSGQDLVMVNNIITVLNSQLPDATVLVEAVFQECNSREMRIEYLVNNTNSTQLLPANTPLAFYANGQLIGQTVTQSDILINGSEAASISLVVPENLVTEFTLTIIVDDNGSGSGLIAEISETNNETTATINFLESDPIRALPQLSGCYLGTEQARYDLTASLSEIDTTFDTGSAVFYASLENLYQDSAALLTPTDYLCSREDTSVYIRLEADPCYAIFSLELSASDCEPIIPQGFSPNGDGYNDHFNIQGLYNVYTQHELLIFNRLGSLVFRGSNAVKWDGASNNGPLKGSKLLPVGTYFYVLHLNSENSQAKTGWVYLNY